MGGLRIEGGCPPPQTTGREFCEGDAKRRGTSIVWISSRFCSNPVSVPRSNGVS